MGGRVEPPDELDARTEEQRSTGATAERDAATTGLGTREAAGGGEPPGFLENTARGHVLQAVADAERHEERHVVGTPRLEAPAEPQTSHPVLGPDQVRTAVAFDLSQLGTRQLESELDVFDGAQPRARAVQRTIASIFGVRALLTQPRVEREIELEPEVSLPRG